MKNAPYWHNDWHQVFYDIAVSTLDQFVIIGVILLIITVVLYENFWNLQIYYVINTLLRIELLV